MLWSCVALPSLWDLIILSTHVSGHIYSTKVWRSNVVECQKSLPIPSIMTWNIYLILYPCIKISYTAYPISPKSIYILSFFSGGNCCWHLFNLRQSKEVNFNMALQLPGIAARGAARFMCGTDGRQPLTSLDGTEFRFGFVNWGDSAKGICSRCTSLIIHTHIYSIMFIYILYSIYFEDADWDGQFRANWRKFTISNVGNPGPSGPQTGGPKGGNSALRNSLTLLEYVVLQQQWCVVWPSEH